MAKKTKELTREEVVAALTEYGTKVAAARVLGVSESAVRRAVRRLGIEVQDGVIQKKDLQDFRKAHDRSYIVPRKIKEALEKLGPECWEYENLFLRIIGGVSQMELNQYRSYFEDYVVETKRGGGGKRVWAGSIELAEKMRDMVL